MGLVGLLLCGHALPNRIGCIFWSHKPKQTLPSLGSSCQMFCYNHETSLECSRKLHRQVWDAAESCIDRFGPQQGSCTDRFGMQQGAAQTGLERSRELRRQVWNAAGSCTLEFPRLNVLVEKASDTCW